tara:strand:- start:435 stop:1538 length:1104 start_codon:yes stop_codon:yes gene_type:complete
MKKINNSKQFKLQIIATGMHLSTEFGLTINEILKEKFKVDKKIEMVLSADTETSISKSIGLGLISFTDALNDLKPDILILLGDRYEILSGSIAALMLKIPIAHIHGGEVTQGAIDESIRHSITKMASIHFTTHDQYRRRIIRMGEQPTSVFNVGGLGVDAIKNTVLLKKKVLEKELGFRFRKKNIIVTFHPVTLEPNTSSFQIDELLYTLKKLNDLFVIFTLSNSDSYSRIINKKIIAFQKLNSERSVVFTSMGNLNFLSTLSLVDGIVGNSSSGLLEAPSFKIGTINIGDRQKGRIKGESIIDCSPKRKSIMDAFTKLYSPNFRNKLNNTVNPYGVGDASEKIMNLLESVKFPINLKKEFYDSCKI